jgi:hypothetical protein
MSKARDIANILSANTAIATDAEVTAAITAATSGLATASSVSTAVTNERTATSTLTNKTLSNPNMSLTNNAIYAAGLNKDYMVKSYDGSTWTQVSFPGFCYREIRVMNGVLCAIGTYSNSVATTAGLVYSTNNALSWTTVTLPTSDIWKGGGYIGGKYVVVGLLNAVYSTDLVNWTTVSLPDLGLAGGYENYWNGVKVVNERMYAFRDTLGLYTDDGVNWNTITYPVSNIKNIIYANNKYTMTGTNNAASSIDGITNWTTSAMPSTGAWEGLAYGNGVYVAHKESSTTMAYSSDAANWNSSSYTAGSAYAFSGIQYYNGKFIGLTDSSADFGIYSTDGINWTNFTKGIATGQGFNVLLPLTENATISSVELSYIDGLTSPAQSQLNSKVSYTGTGTLTNKTIDGNLNTINVKRGTTQQRPVSATAGDQYYDTTENALYNYASNGWLKVSQDPAPAIISISPTVAPVAGTSITINGSGFKSGALVKFVGTNAVEYSATSVTVTSLALITAVTPQLFVAYEPYSIKVTNVDNQFGIANNVLDAGGTPSWVTASGNIKTLKENTALSATSVSATDPDGTAIIYSSTNLPAWASINSSTGAITGTTPGVNSSTTYTFDITASDGTNTSTRSFNIVVQPDIVRINLVTHLDASNSSSYSGSGSTWYDLSGNGNNATLYNGVSYSTSGSGGHLSLDASNGYMQLSGNSAAAPYNLQTFSIDMWVYRYAKTDGYEILWSQDYTQHSPPYYSNHIRYDNDTDTLGGTWGGPAGVSSSVWQHWVFAKDSSSGTYKIYKNGVEIYSASAGNITFYTNPLWIGKSNFNTSSSLNFGSIRYYSKYLSAAEAAKNFDATKSRFGL